MARDWDDLDPPPSPHHALLLRVELAVIGVLTLYSVGSMIVGLLS